MEHHVLLFGQTLNAQSESMWLGLAGFSLITPTGAAPTDAKEGWLLTEANSGGASASASPSTHVGKELGPAGSVFQKLVKSTDMETSTSVRVLFCIEYSCYSHY